ncbi:MAG: efflux RND transporter periplasmic adaptor subunit [Gammaproteobacteria bacterium]
MNLREFIAAAVLSAFMPCAVAAPLEVSEQEQRLLGIEVQPVALAEGVGAELLNLRVSFSPDAEWDVRAPLPGVLTAVAVREGDAVEQGEALATLRSSEFVALQQDYLKALAEYEVAEAARARDRKLRDAGSISERRWQETRYDWAAARAARAGLAGQLMAAGLRSSDLAALASSDTLSPDLVLRARAPALVLERDAHPGGRVDGSETLLRLGDPRQLVLEGVLSRAAAVNLAEGTRLRALDGGDEAVVSFVSRVIDPRSQTVTVRAVPDDAAGLRPGELSAWSVVTGEDLLMVPAGAVVRLNDRDVVYVAVPQGFEEREVDARSSAAGAWLVRSGLREGERVAVRGTAALKGLSLGMGGGD